MEILEKCFVNNDSLSWDVFNGKMAEISRRRDEYKRTDNKEKS